MKKTFSGITVELQNGDITQQEDIDAVVNAANSELRIGGGVAGAIHRAAGPELEKECRNLAPISPGEAVITGAYNLPNKYIIHCLGPVYGIDQPEDELLAECYRNALFLAEESNISTIAFPAISTGAFGYPMEDAARVALKTIKEEAAKFQNVGLIRFVLFDEQSYELHCNVLEGIV